MAELDIFEHAPKRWFDYGGDSEVLLLYAGKEVLTRIRHKAAEIAAKTGGDFNAISIRLVGRYAVKGWRKKSDHNHPGLTVSGQPIPYSGESLDILMRRSNEFSDFVNRKCADADFFRTATEVNIDDIAADLFSEEIEARGTEDDSKNV